MRREEESIANIEALLVGCAVGPGFDVAGAEELGDVQARERAAKLPVIHEGAAEEVLADALDRPAFGFGGLGEFLGFGLKGFEVGVGEDLGELEGAADEEVEVVEVGGFMGGAGAFGEGFGGNGGWDAEFGNEGAGDLGERPGDEVGGGNVGSDGEPDLEGDLGALEAYPVGLRREGEVEAIVNGGLFEEGVGDGVEGHGGWEAYRLGGWWLASEKHSLYRIQNQTCVIHTFGLSLRRNGRGPGHHRATVRPMDAVEVCRKVA